MTGWFAMADSAAPDSLDVGDPIPEEWDYQPANEAARRQLADDDRDLCGGFPADEEVSLTGTYGCFD
jgi:hypothetical protein